MNKNKILGRVAIISLTVTTLAGCYTDNSDITRETLTDIADAYISDATTVNTRQEYCLCIDDTDGNETTMSGTNYLDFATDIDEFSKEETYTAESYEGTYSKKKNVYSKINKDESYSIYIIEQENYGSESSQQYVYEKKLLDTYLNKSYTKSDFMTSNERKFKLLENMEEFEGKDCYVLEGEIDAKTAYEEMKGTFLFDENSDISNSNLQDKNITFKYYINSEDKRPLGMTIDIKTLFSYVYGDYVKVKYGTFKSIYEAINKSNVITFPDKEN